MAYLDGNEQLFGIIGQVGQAGVNLLNLDPNDGYEVGYCLALNDYGGVDQETRAEWATSGYIPVTPGKKYLYAHEQAWPSGKYTIALFYYTEKGGTPQNGQRYPTNFSSAQGGWFFTAPAGVSYVRLPLDIYALPVQNGTSVVYEVG